MQQECASPQNTDTYYVNWNFSLAACTSTSGLHGDRVLLLFESLYLQLDLRIWTCFPSFILFMNLCNERINQTRNFRKGSGGRWLCKLTWWRFEIDKTDISLLPTFQPTAALLFTLLLTVPDNILVTGLQIFTKYLLYTTVFV